MSSDNIKVVIRARPDKKCNTEFVPWVIDKKKIYQIDEDKTIIGDTYSYDEVFNVHTKNVDIYETAISSLVSSAIEGINLTIFAYGATSSGKTYTMNGIPEDPGIIPRFIEHIFDQVELYSQRKFLIRVSYVEIYSEIINDLLDKSNKDLKIREDVHNCVSYNPKEQIVKSSGECMQVMKTGAYNRTVGETQMNQCSSRSHAIFRIVIESAPTSGGENDPVQVSHVNLIDLAGSERVSQTGATGQRFKEGAHINKSLTALGLVMKQLVEKNEYVNYRDSKLTRILSNSLGGNAKTLIICNINLLSLEDTASTLMFAQRAKAVKNKPKVNEVMTEAALTKRYAKECDEIKKLLESEFEKNKQLEVERDMSNKKISELDSRIKSLQEIFVKKDPVVRPPKRRHTFCTLGAISEERELENASKNLITVGLSGEGDSRRSSGFDSTISPPRRNSCVNGLESGISNNKTPTKSLRDRLEILTREHEELIEYTRLEKCENQTMTKKFEQFKNECQGLKLLAEERYQQLQSEQEKAEQMKVDYEFILETQKKKFQRRESELLEQINKFLKKTEFEQPASIENLPLPNTPNLNTFEYEEMSEKIASCKKQIEELQNNSQTLKLENEDLNVIVADLRKSVNTLELQNSQLKIKNKSLQSKVLDMELKVNNSQQAADSSNDDIDLLKKQIQGLEGNNKELKTELGRLREELYESQDKLIEVTEDLDIEEKKSSGLKKKLTDEEKMRQKVEKELQTEVDLRKDSESELVKERVLRQEAESELVKERVLRQEAESELAKERVLRQEAESELVKDRVLRQEAESELVKDRVLREEAQSELVEKTVLTQEAESELVKERVLRHEAESELVKGRQLRQEVEAELFKGGELIDTADSMLVSETNLRQEIESKLVKEMEMRLKLELESLEKKDLLKEAETKYFVEVELRKEIKQTLYTLQKILEQNSPSTKKTNMIIINKHKESVSEYESVQDTSEVMSESYLDISDAAISLNYTSPNESMQEIDQENLESFSSSYFKDSSKSNNFMNFFNSFVNNDNEVLQRRQSIQLKNDEKEEKHETGLNELEKLRKDFDSMQLQRESDILTINKLQAKLDEYGCMNLSDSEKLNKTNKILEALNALEAEKTENQSVIQTLKEQLQNDAVKLEELNKILGLKGDDLKRKNEEIQMLRKEICSPVDKSGKECIETNDKVPDVERKLEKEINDLNEENSHLNELIETQKTELKKYLQNFEDKETELRNLADENKIMQEKVEEVGSKLKQEREATNQLTIQMELFRTQVKELGDQLQEKETIIRQVNNEKMNKENGTKVIREEKYDLENKMELQSDTFQKCHDISSNQEINMHNLLSKIERINGEQDVNNKSLCTGDEEKVEDLLNIIQELNNEIQNLSISNKDKEGIVAKMKSEKMDLEKEKVDLCDKLNDFLIEVRMQTDNIGELKKIIENKELSFQKLTENNEKLIEERNNIHSIFKDESEKNVNLMKDIEKLEMKSGNLSSSLKEKEIIIAQISKEKSILEEEKTYLTLKMKNLYAQLEQQKENEILWNQGRKEVIDLLSKIKEMANEIENLSIVIQDKEKIDDIRQINLQKEKSDLCEKINDIKFQVQAQTNHLRELSKIIENKELGCQKMMKEYEMLQKVCEQIELTLKEEREKNVDLLKNFGELESKLEKLSLSEKEREMIIVKINTEKSNLEEERNNLRIKIGDLHREIETSSNEEKEKVLLNNIKQLKDEIEKSSIVIKNNDRITAIIKVEKINLEKEKSDLSNKVNNLMTQVQTQKNHITELSETIENKELSSEKIVKENDILKKEHELIHSTLKEEREKNLDLVTNIEKLEIDYKNLLLSAEEKESIITQITAEKMGLEKQRNDCSLKINDLLTKVEEKESIITQVTAEKMVLEQQRNDLSLQINDLLTETEEKESIITQITAEKMGLEQQRNDISLKINDLLTKTEEKESIITQITAEKMDLEQQRNDLSLRINDLLTKTEEKESIITQITAEKMDLEQQRNDLSLRINDLLTKTEEKESIITQITAEKMGLEQLRNDFSLKINDLLTKIEEQDKKMRRQNEILEDKELGLQKLSKEYEKFKEENKENAILSKSEGIHHENLSRDIGELTMENAKLSASISELSNINREKINEIRSVEKCFKQENDLILLKMKNERMENEKEKQKLLYQINHLKATVETQLIKMEALQEVLNNNEIHIKKLETYNQELEQDIKNKELLLTKEKEQVLILENNCKLIDELKRENSASMEGFYSLLKSKEASENDLFDLRADFSEKLGDHITKMKSLLGIEEEKSFKARMIQRKLETKWEELKKIENVIPSLIKGATATIINKTKVEEAERTNKKLTAEIQSLEEQKKFLQLTLEKMRTDNEIALSDNQKQLQHANNKLKAMYVTLEQDKKKIENLEYELQTISKKPKPVGNSNYNSEKNVSELKNSEDKWKQQRAEAHDSRRSIDLNTLCSESTAFKCKCENMDAKVQEMKLEISQLQDFKEVLSLKYEKAKKLCRMRNDQINELNEKLRKFTSA